MAFLGNRSEIQAMDVQELKRTFGQHVQALRKEKGLTQENLAEAIGKSVDQISNIERGATSTRLDTALAIATALDVNLPELFSFSGEKVTSRKDKREIPEDLYSILRERDENTIRAITSLVKTLLENFRAT